MIRAHAFVDRLLEEEDDDPPATIKLPTVHEIVRILREHPLVKLRVRGKIKRGWLIGSFSGGKGRAHSDVDVALLIPPQPDMTSAQFTEWMRRGLRQHFMKHDVRGKADHLHPQWDGRRLDFYFVYDESEVNDGRPLQELAP